MQLYDSQPDLQAGPARERRTVIVRDQFRIDVQDAVDRFTSNRSQYPNATQHKLAFKALLDKRCGVYAKTGAQNMKLHAAALAEFDRCMGVAK